MMILAFILTGILAFVVGAGCCVVFLLWLGWRPADDDDDDSDDASGSRWMVDREPGPNEIETSDLPKITELVKK